MIELRAFMRRHGQRTVALTLLGFLCAALLLAHSAIGMEHQTETGDHAMQDALSVCLAVVEIAGAFVLLAAAPKPFLHRRRLGAQGTPPVVDVPALLQAPGSARAGPAALQVFRL